MSLWADRLFPLVYDPFLWVGERLGMRRVRAQVVGRARGRVLEVGAGTGLNLPHYPDDLSELVLTEPEEGMARRLTKRVDRASRDARVVIAGAERLPFDDRSFDSVICTLVLCTVPELERSLAEIRRVLVPGGQLLFIEHVRAPSGSRTARWQERLHDPWRAFANGCHCNRETLSAIENAGFSVRDTTSERWQAMPPIVAPIVTGRAA